MYTHLLSIKKSAIEFKSIAADNKSAVRIITYQITLVTESKEPTIEEQLESALYQSGFNYQMITEYVNDDNSVTRVYEIKQEEIKYE